MKLLFFNLNNKISSTTFCFLLPSISITRFHDNCKDSGSSSSFSSLSLEFNERMPFCNVGSYQKDDDAAGNNGIKIFYRTYGQGPVKVLMIIGLGGTHDSWAPQIKTLAGAVEPNDDESPAGDRSSDGENESLGIEVCAFDNRGMANWPKLCANQEVVVHVTSASSANLRFEIG